MVLSQQHMFIKTADREKDSRPETCTDPQSGETNEIQHDEQPEEETLFEITDKNETVA